MAFTDLTLQLSAAQAITATAASTTVYDVTGAGVGNAPNQKFGTSSVFGDDIGVGRVVYAWFTVSTAFVSGGGATLTIQIQASPSATNNTASGYVTIFASAAFTAAQLTAGKSLVVPIPPAGLIGIGETLPRFYQFNYVVGTSTFSAGALNAYISLEPPTGFVSTLYPSNFVSGL